MPQEVNTSLTCAAREVCPLVNTTTCTARCIAYHFVNQQVEASGIPKRFQRIDIDGQAHAANLANAHRLMGAEQKAAFAELTANGWGRGHKDALPGAGTIRNVEKGAGLFAWSREKGVGKTTLATAILGEYIVTRTLDIVWNQRKPVAGLLAYYVHMPTYMQNVKDMFKDDRDVAARAAAKVAKTQDSIRRAELVLFDEVGGESPTDATRERLRAIFDEKYREERAYIVTSNVPVNELAVTLDERVADRMRDLTELTFGGKSKRGQRKGA